VISQASFTFTLYEILAAVRPLGPGGSREPGSQHAQDAKSTPHRETIFRYPVLFFIIAIMRVRSDSSCWP
jgi:hypothetical protein